MTLNSVVALILRYFTEFGSFRGSLCKSIRVRCHRRKFTFGISSPDELFGKFVVTKPPPSPGY